MSDAVVRDNYGDELVLQYEPAIRQDRCYGYAKNVIDETEVQFSFTRNQLIELRHHLNEIIEEMPDED